MIEHSQQISCIGAQPRKQPIEGNEACAAAENTIEANPQLAASTRRRICPIGLEISVEQGDVRADTLLCNGLWFGRSVALVDQPLGMPSEARADQH